MNEFPIIAETLPGGLRSLLLPRADRQTISFLVLIAVGSRYETAPQSGLSHFLEHMFFKGTQTRPSSKEIAEAIDSVGGEFNAFTAEEYTGYYVTVAAEYLERAAEVVSDILLRPLFAPQEIEREKGVILEEIRMYTGNPMAHVQHLWHEALFGQHPLGRRIDGLPGTVNAFQQADFARYVKRHYHAPNTVVAVAGNFSVEPTRALIRRLFAPLPGGAEVKPRKAPARLPGKKVVHERRPALEQTHLILGVPGLPFSHKQRWAAQLLATILGGGMSSRLFLAVRERRGLAYAVRTEHQSFVDTGSFSTQAGVRTDKALEAARVIVEEYDRVMSEPVAPDELNKAKNMLYGHLMLELEETNSLAMFAASQAVLTSRLLTPQQIHKRISAVTAATIQAVALQLLAPPRRSLAVLGPQRTSEAFLKLIV